MRRIRWFAALIDVAIAPLPALAQENATVTGRVTNAQGGPENAVTVRVDRFNAGTTTAADGTYRLVIPGARLQGSTSVTITASRQGLATVSRTVTLAPGAALTQNFELGAAAVELQGLVVTALGIEREEKALGYSVQAVQGSELAETPSTNVVSALSGRIAGVSVTNVGPQGGSARITIRGANSIAGNNQPLFVVDGVPIDNSAPRNQGYGGIDYGNTAGDLNPNDIESLSVLKGPNAAALYGSRAANGAIVITTKSGRNTRGLGIVATQDVSFETPLRLPSYQNEFGQGFDGEFEYLDGNYGGVNDGVDESWGPALDQGFMIPQWNSPIVGGVRTATPWVSHPDNVRNFFETGRTLNTNVAVSAASERANVRLSGTRLDQDGMTPGMSLERTTVALNGGASLTDRLTANASVQYIRQDGNNRPGTGYDDANPMMQFIWFGRQVDVADMKTYRNEDGSMRSWNYSYHPNPYWVSLAATNNDNRDRVIGTASVKYQLNDWLSAQLRSGTDWYNDSRQWNQPAGTFGLYVGRLAESVGPNGGFELDNRFRREMNTDFLLTADRYINDDLSLVVNVGGNHRRNEYKNEYSWVRSLVAPDVFNVSNAAETPFIQNYREEKEVNSLYGQASFGFRDFFFIDLTGRNDWSSTLPEGNNSYFYPSVSSSLVFSDIVSLPWLNTGKLRASWARVGNDADPYQLAGVANAGIPFRGIPNFTVGNTIANADLKPETTTSWETGLELGFLDGRLNLDLAYYNKATTNQILAIQVSPTSGFTNQVINAGEVTNKGFEASASVIPVRTESGFEWEVRANYGRNESEVSELFGDVSTVVLGVYWSLNVEARLNEPYGALFGNGFLRDEDGNIMVSAAGIPRRDPVRRVLGNYNPDWVGSLRNSLRYRGLDFSFMFDTKQGGEMFSVTQMFGRYAGVLEETLAGRCVQGGAQGGMPACDANTGIVWDGVAPDGSPNTRVVSSQQLWHALYGNHEAHMYDASFVKLREMSLAYSVPSSMARRLGITGLNLAIVGRNLWLDSEIPNVDPETAFDASNVQGLEFGQLPTPKSVGFTVTVTP